MIVPNVNIQLYNYTRRRSFKQCEIHIIPAYPYHSALQKGFVRKFLSLNGFDVVIYKKACSHETGLEKQPL